MTRLTNRQERCLTLIQLGCVALLLAWVALGGDPFGFIEVSWVFIGIGVWFFIRCLVGIIMPIVELLESLRR